MLCGGALGSPRLLLASASEAWPRGCANGSGLVGRNLMFHLSELIAVWPRQAADFTGLLKTIALRDFYFRDGQRLGLVQSLGLSASYGNIVQVLNDRFDRALPPALRPLRGLTRIPALLASWVLGDARVFVGILEDLPYPSNRVVLEDGDPERLKIEYAFAPELVARHRAFRRLLKAAMRGQRCFYLNLAPELNFGHPCGTLRFGADPATSVLDPSCRAHGLENLYVADFVVHADLDRGQPEPDHRRQRPPGRRPAGRRARPGSSPGPAHPRRPGRDPPARARSPAKRVVIRLWRSCHRPSREARPPGRRPPVDERGPRPGGAGYRRRLDVPGA